MGEITTKFTGTHYHKLILYQRYSVMNFGAIGDGVEDDTEAIQDAIDANSIVLFPPGTYKDTGNHTITKDLIIIGDDVNIVGGTSDTFLVLSDNDEIDNIKISGVNFENYKYVIATTNTHTVSVDNLICENIKLSSGERFLYCDNSTTVKINNIDISHSRFDNCKYPISFAGYFDSVNVSHNYFTGCYGYNIRLGINDAQYRDGCRNIVVTNNRFYDVKDTLTAYGACVLCYGYSVVINNNTVSKIYTDRCFYAKAHSGTISNNSISDVRFDAEGNNNVVFCGIYMKGIHMVVSGNSILSDDETKVAPDNYYYGIVVDGSKAIINNNYVGGFFRGINCYSMTTNVVIVGNQIIRETPSAGSGILCDINATYVIENNMIVNHGNNNETYFYGELEQPEIPE